MSQTYWIAIDENNEETIHQYEPYYNQLHMKWMSTTKVYVSKGLMTLVADYTREDMVIAIAIELETSPVKNKSKPLKIKKIFKEYDNGVSKTNR